MFHDQVVGTFIIVEMADKVLAAETTRAEKRTKNVGKLRKMLWISANMIDLCMLYVSHIYIYICMYVWMDGCMHACMHADIIIYILKYSTRIHLPISGVGLEPAI